MSCNEWKETEIGRIPFNWDFASMKDYVEINMGQSPKSEFYNTTGEGLPFLQGNRTFGLKYPYYDTYTSEIKKKAHVGDVLFSVRAPVGDVNIATEECCIGRGIASLRIKNGSQGYLYYLLREYRRYIENRESGTVFGSINKKGLEELKLPFPPIEEQEKIANILSSLDDKIELNNEMNKTLEEMAQALFKRWFVDFEFPNENGEPYKSSGGEMVESELGMIPKGWEVKSLKNLINLTMGLSPKSSSYNNDRIGMQLLNGAADFNNTNIIPTKYTTDPKRICNVGDIIFCIRGTIGNITFADDTYCLGRGVASLSPINDIDRGIIFLNLNLMLDKLKANASGSVILGISKSDIEDSKIIVSNKILREKFNGIFKSIYDDIKNSNEESNNLIKLRDTLLPKLMSGEIRVK